MWSFDVADHGGLIVAVPVGKGYQNSILFTWDYGNTWNRFQFQENPIAVVKVWNSVVCSVCACVDGWVWMSVGVYVRVSVCGCGWVCGGGGGGGWVGGGGGGGGGGAPGPPPPPPPPRAGGGGG